MPNQSFQPSSRVLLCAVLGIFLIGCSEGNDADAVAERPPEKVTPGTVPEDRIETDKSPHPQSSTGGEIPTKENGSTKN